MLLSTTIAAAAVQGHAFFAFFASNTLSKETGTIRNNRGALTSLSINLRALNRTRVYSRSRWCGAFFFLPSTNSFDVGPCEVSQLASTLLIHLPVSSPRAFSAAPFRGHDTCTPPLRYSRSWSSRKTGYRRLRTGNRGRKAAVS